MIGAGMLGLGVLSIALSMGVPDVDVADISPARREWARLAGATTVGEKLNGEFDVVFDAVGSLATRRTSVELLRAGGVTVWIGLHGEETTLDGLDLIRMEKKVLGTFCYHHQDYLRAIDLAAGFDLDRLSSSPLEHGVEVFYGLLESTSPVVKSLLIP